MSAVLRGERGGPSAALGGHWRNRALRADDQRSPPAPDLFSLSPIQSVLADIVMHVRGRPGLSRRAFFFIQGETIMFFLLVLRQLRVGVEFFATQRPGPLHRRDGTVGPHACKIGVAVRSARQSLLRTGDLHGWC